jgi:hypothetical protein
LPHTFINHSELTDAAVAEIEQFKAALRKYYSSKDCEMMLFDRCIGTRGAFHMHLQVSERAHTLSNNYMYYMTLYVLLSSNVVRHHLSAIHDTNESGKRSIAQYAVCCALYVA